VLGHVYSPRTWTAAPLGILYIKYADDVYPSLSLMAAARALGRTAAEIVVYAGGRPGRRYVHPCRAAAGCGSITRPDRTLRYISASDVLSGSYRPEDLKDKVVFLAPRRSPLIFRGHSFSARMRRGEERDGGREHPEQAVPEEHPGFVVSLAVLVTGLILSLLLPQLRAMNAHPVRCPHGRGAALNQYLFAYQDTTPISSILRNMRSSRSSRSPTVPDEERKAKELKKMFSHYVSPKIVDELLKNPELAKLGGTGARSRCSSRRAGFTTFSECASRGGR